MRSEQRLERLLPGLTARERAQAVIDAWKDDQPWDRSLRQSMPSQQAYEVQWRLEEAGSLNAHVAWLLSLEELRIKHHWTLLNWLATLTMRPVDETANVSSTRNDDPAGSRSAADGEALRNVLDTVKRDLFKGIQRFPQTFEEMPTSGANDDVSVGEEESLAADLLAQLKTAVATSWREVRALQHCLDSAQDDLLHPALHEALAEAESCLDMLADVASRLFGELELADPSAAEIEEMTRALDLDLLA